MKSLLAKTGNFAKFRHALREWRNTPRFDGLSPAQWLTGYRQRTEAVAAPAAYQRVSDEQLKSHEDRRGRSQTEVKKRIDRSSRSLEQLKTGDQVLVQDHKTLRWSKEAKVLSRRKNRRSYWVDIDGRRCIRNRRFLKPKPDQCHNNVHPQCTTDSKMDSQKRDLRSRRRVAFK